MAEHTPFNDRSFRSSTSSTSWPSLYRRKKLHVRCSDGSQFVILTDDGVFLYSLYTVIELTHRRLYPGRAPIEVRILRDGSSDLDPEYVVGDVLEENQYLNAITVSLDQQDDEQEYADAPTRKRKRVDSGNIASSSISFMSLNRDEGFVYRKRVRNEDNHAHPSPPPPPPLPSAPTAAVSSSTSSDIFREPRRLSFAKSAPASSHDVIELEDSSAGNRPATESDQGMHDLDGEPVQEVTPRKMSTASASGKGKEKMQLKGKPTTIPTPPQQQPQQQLQQQQQALRLSAVEKAKDNGVSSVASAAIAAPKKEEEEEEDEEDRQGDSVVVSIPDQLSDQVMSDVSEDGSVSEHTDDDEEEENEEEEEEEEEEEMEVASEKTKKKKGVKDEKAKKQKKQKKEKEKAKKDTQKSVRPSLMKISPLKGRVITDRRRHSKSPFDLSEDDGPFDTVTVGRGPGSAGKRLCQAHTKGGKPCAFKARPRSNFCGMHQSVEGTGKDKTDDEAEEVERHEEQEEEEREEREEESAPKSRKDTAGHSKKSKLSVTPTDKKRTQGKAKHETEEEEDEEEEEEKEEEEEEETDGEVEEESTKARKNSMAQEKKVQQKAASTVQPLAAAPKKPAPASEKAKQEEDEKTKPAPTAAVVAATSTPLSNKNSLLKNEVSTPPVAVESVGEKAKQTRLRLHSRDSEHEGGEMEEQKRITRAKSALAAHERSKLEAAAAATATAAAPVTPLVATADKNDTHKTQQEKHVGEETKAVAGPAANVLAHQDTHKSAAATTPASASAAAVDEKTKGKSKPLSSQPVEQEKKKTTVDLTSSSTKAAVPKEKEKASTLSADKSSAQKQKNGKEAIDTDEEDEEDEEDDVAIDDSKSTKAPAARKGLSGKQSADVLAETSAHANKNVKSMPNNKPTAAHSSAKKVTELAVVDGPSKDDDEEDSDQTVDEEEESEEEAEKGAGRSDKQAAAKMKDASTAKSALGTEWKSKREKTTAAAKPTKTTETPAKEEGKQTNAPVVKSTLPADSNSKEQTKDGVLPASSRQAGKEQAAAKEVPTAKTTEKASDKKKETATEKHKDKEVEKATEKETGKEKRKKKKKNKQSEKQQEADEEEEEEETPTHKKAVPVVLEPAAVAVPLSKSKKDRSPVSLPKPSNAAPLSLPVSVVSSSNTVQEPDTPIAMDLEQPNTSTTTSTPPVPIPVADAAAATGKRKTKTDKETESDKSKTKQQKTEPTSAKTSNQTAAPATQNGAIAINKESFLKDVLSSIQEKGEKKEEKQEQESHEKRKKKHKKEKEIEKESKNEKQSEQSNKKGSKVGKEKLDTHNTDEEENEAVSMDVDGDKEAETEKQKEKEREAKRKLKQAKKKERRKRTREQKEMEEEEEEEEEKDFDETQTDGEQHNLIKQNAKEASSKSAQNRPAVKPQPAAESQNGSTSKKQKTSASSEASSKPSSVQPVAVDQPKHGAKPPKDTLPTPAAGKPTKPSNAAVAAVDAKKDKTVTAPLEQEPVIKIVDNDDGEDDEDESGNELNHMESTQLYSPLEKSPSQAKRIVSISRRTKQELIQQRKEATKPKPSSLRKKFVESDASEEETFPLSQLEEYSTAKVKRLVSTASDSDDDVDDTRSLLELASSAALSKAVTPRASPVSPALLSPTTPVASSTPAKSLFNGFKPFSFSSFNSSAGAGLGAGVSTSGKTSVTPSRDAIMFTPLSAASSGPGMVPDATPEEGIPSPSLSGMDVLPRGPHGRMVIPKTDSGTPPPPIVIRKKKASPSY